MRTQRQERVGQQEPSSAVVLAVILALTAIAGGAVVGARLHEAHDERVQAEWFSSCLDAGHAVNECHFMWKNK